MGLIISRPSVICMGTGSLFVYGFRQFCEKARPLRRKIVFAVASIKDWFCRFEVKRTEYVGNG